MDSLINLLNPDLISVISSYIHIKNLSNFLSVYTNNIDWISLMNTLYVNNIYEFVNVYENKDITKNRCELNFEYIKDYESTFNIQYLDDIVKLNIKINAKELCETFIYINYIIYENKNKKGYLYEDFYKEFEFDIKSHNSNYIIDYYYFKILLFDLRRERQLSGNIMQIPTLYKNKSFKQCRYF